MDTYLIGWRDRIRKQRQAQEVERHRLDDAARRCATVLVQRFGARRVFLFGSVARGDILDEHSDLDLAVEGLAAQHYWRALTAISKEVDRPVQLIPLESAAPSLVRRVQQEGRLLLES